MNSKVTKDFILIIVIGTAYYFLHTHLIGITAAFAFPEWYVSFAQENKALSLILFSMVIKVPAAALAALLAGFSIVRWVSRHRIWWGIAMLFGVTVFHVLRLELSGGSIKSLETFILPPSVIDVPLLVAWWTFLPLSIALLVRGSKTSSG